jgi:hypothetical protein
VIGRPIPASRFDQAHAPGRDQILERKGSRQTRSQPARYRFD